MRDVLIDTSARITFFRQGSPGSERIANLIVDAEFEQP